MNTFQHIPKQSIPRWSELIHLFFFFFFVFLANDGSDIHSAVLATIRKLEDGYFGGAR